MARNLNRVVLNGNLTADPEIKYLPSGMAVCEVSIGNNDSYKNNAGETVETVSFFTLKLWGRTAEIAGKYLRKGSNITAEGKLRQERWEKDGQKHSKVIVNVDSLYMHGGKKDDDQGGGERQRQSRPAAGQQRSGGSRSQGGGYKQPESGSARQQRADGDDPPPGDDIPF